jgi:hypothetical protein
MHHDDVGAETYVAQALADSALAGRGPGQLAQRGGGNPPQAQQQRHERDGVDQEDPARADGDGQDAGYRGSDHPGHVERGAVEGNRIGQVVVPDQFGDEGLAHGGIQGGHHAEHQGKAVDVPELCGAGEHEDPEACAQHGHGGLREHQQLSAVKPVGHQPCHRREEELGAQLQGHRDTHGSGVLFGQMVKDQPVLGGALHPGADVGDQCPDEPDPIVQDVQRFEGGRHARPSARVLPKCSNP